MDFWTPLTWLLILSPPATSLDDLARFPDHRECVVACEFNLLHAARLSECRGALAVPLRPTNYSIEIAAINAAIRETYRLWWAWDSLRIAQDRDGATVAQRLYWLNQLRAEIGEAAYAAGQMPPTVPYWRFTWVNPPAAAP